MYIYIYLCTLIHIVTADAIHVSTGSDRVLACPRSTTAVANAFGQQTRFRGVANAFDQRQFDAFVDLTLQRSMHMNRCAMFLSVNKHVFFRR